MTDTVSVYFVFTDDGLRPEHGEINGVLREKCTVQPTESDHRSNASSTATSQTFVYEDVTLTTDWSEQATLMPVVPSLRLRFDDVYFQPRTGSQSVEEVRDHSRQVVTLVSQLYERLSSLSQSPIYVVGLSPAHTEILTHDAYPETITERGLAENRLEFISWLQIVPPEMAESVGVERLLSAPVVRAERLDDCAVLLLVHTTPTMVDPEHDPDEVFEHLGL